MLRKLVPFITVLLSVLLDTSVIHVLYHGIYLIPLSMVVIIMISILKGRTQGVLYGLIAGLILDVSTGSLGLKLFGYIAIGFLIGFLLDQQDHSHTADRDQRIRNAVSRAIWILVFVGLYELVMLMYQYFSTAIFSWAFVRSMLIRTGMIALICTLFYPFFRRIYLGKGKYADKQATREVKNY